MIKIINPNPTAKLFLKYSGRRVNFMYQDPTLQTVYLRYNKQAILLTNQYLEKFDLLMEQIFI